MPSKKKLKTVSKFVSYEKLLETIDVFKRLSKLRANESVDKKPLFEETDDLVIKLQINYKKIPSNKSTYIHAIPLPNHWRHESDYETCLIVKDINKTPLSDRDLDLDVTKSHYKELLSKDNSDQLVSSVLPMRELRNEYKVIEAKQRLCKSFDVFVCDCKLLNNRFDYLPRFLGKTFWLDNKKIPIRIDLTAPDLRSQLETKLNETHLYLSGKGDTSVVNIGLAKQSTERLADNLLAVINKLWTLFGDNIRSLSIKTDKSIALTFFMDCGLINDIQMKPFRRERTTIEDDFSHFTHSNVQILQNGNIRVVPKAKEDIDSSEEMNEAESKWLSRDTKRDNRKRNKKIKYKVKTQKSRNKRRKVVKSVGENCE